MITELSKLGFDPLLNNLLYGNAIYSEETTPKVFLIIQQFSCLLKTLKGLVSRSFKYNYILNLYIHSVHYLVWKVQSFFSFFNVIIIDARILVRFFVCCTHKAPTYERRQ